MIDYTDGNAAQPKGDGNKIIAHVCNDAGYWGRGFVLSVRQCHPQAEKAFRQWYSQLSPWNSRPFMLGESQLVQVTNDTWVANMVGQSGVCTVDSVPPIRYDALRSCLHDVSVQAQRLNASVHMPRIGCGLAGGEWGKVEQIVKDMLCDTGVQVMVYDLQPIGLDNVT